ncbi:MAG: HDOD domain-containing protein [Psychrosphaera sp.]|nr:HDOD domain-containing protein [Psychrosphaera sp.]
MALNRSKLVEIVQNIPAFPQSVNQVIAMTSNAMCPPKKLVQVIERDPILTIKVLKLVNSAFFGLSKEVISVQHSVVYVGLNTVKNVAISVAMSGVLPEHNDAGLDMAQYWKDSLAVGVIAKMLAEKHKVPPNETADYFVAGLLHNIGKVLFAHYFPTEYKEVLEITEAKRIPLHKVEKKLLGLDHCQLGGLLAKEWQLPENLRGAIRHHHTMVKDYGDNKLLVAIIAASQLNHYINASVGVLPQLPKQVEDYLGAPLIDVAESLENLERELDKAQAFIDVN